MGPRSDGVNALRYPAKKRVSSQVKRLKLKKPAASSAAMSWPPLANNLTLFQLSRTSITSCDTAAQIVMEPMPLFEYRN